MFYFPSSLSFRLILIELMSYKKPRHTSHLHLSAKITYASLILIHQQLKQLHFSRTLQFIDFMPLTYIFRNICVTLSEQNFDCSCNCPGFDSRWEWCKNRASRPAQGTINGGAVSE